MSPRGTRLPILVVFNTIQLYGMERAVLRAFDLLSPQVEAHFVLTRTCRRQDLPVWREVGRFGFDCHFLSDHTEWPRLSRPRGLRHLLKLLWAWGRGNVDVFQALRRSRARALLLPSPAYALFGMLAGTYCRLRGWPTILQFHNLELKYSPLLRMLDPLLSSYCHCSELGKEMTLEANPYLRRRKHYVIPNRTVVLSAQPLAELVDPRRRRLVYVGQVVEHKGVDLMISSFLKVAKSHPDVELHVVGEGTEEYVAKMKRLAQPAAGRIIFWGYREDAERILAGATAHLFPTPPSRYHESFGNVAVEAMALGVPSVAFASGAVPSIVADGRTGFVVEHEDPESFAAAIEILLADPERRDRMAARARRRFEDSFSDPVIRRAWLQLLESVS